MPEDRPIVMCAAEGCEKTFTQKGIKQYCCTFHRKKPTIAQRIRSAEYKENKRNDLYLRWRFANHLFRTNAANCPVCDQRPTFGYNAEEWGDDYMCVKCCFGELTIAATEPEICLLKWNTRLVRMVPEVYFPEE